MAVLSRPSRSPRTWAVRSGIAITVAMLGYFGITHTIAANVRSFDATEAAALAPRDGRNVAANALAIAIRATNDTERSRADQLARVALRLDPTATEALSTLGIDAQTRGDVGAARRFFTYSMRLSRRELQAQLWAIEDAVAHGDVPGALLHYDIALRTSRAAPDLLYPVLSGAIPDPSIRTALTRRLALRPIWGPTFLDFVADKAADPGEAAKLFVQLSSSGLTVPQKAQANVVARLLAKGDTAKAWAFYAIIRSGVDRQRSRDPAISRRYDYPTPFDWQSVDSVGLTASVQPETGGGVIDFAAPAGIGGLVAQQLQFLPPGNYRLTGVSADIVQPERSKPYWVLACTDGHELGRVDLSNSRVADGRFEGRFVVPAGCPAQTLALGVRPSDSVSGVTGQIRGIALVPAL